MPARRPDQRFRDIVENIDLIIQFAADMPFDQYLADARTRLAVERCRSILAEAARKLGTEAESRCPEVPWIDTVRLIPGCGEYPIITHRVVSNIITHDLAASRWHVSGS